MSFEQPQREMFQPGEMSPEIVDHHEQKLSFEREYSDVVDLVEQYQKLKQEGDTLNTLYMHPGKRDYMVVRNSEEFKQFMKEKGVDTARMYHDLKEQ